MKKVILLLPFATLIAVGTAYANSGEELTQKYKCQACHKVDKKAIGPSYQDIANKYAGDAAAPAQIAEHIKKGSRGVWGPAPMPAQSSVPDEDLKTIVDYVMSLKK
jgi:cytochrome c